MTFFYAGPKTQWLVMKKQLFVTSIKSKQLYKQQCTHTTL